MKEALVIALDIGGTHTKAGLVSYSGKCLASERFDTPGTDFEDFMQQLQQALAPLQAEAAEKLIGIAAAAPSVNSRSGCVHQPPNLPWPAKTALGEQLQRKFGYPSVLINDAEAAALGELVYGKAKNVQDFIYITLGTGLGAAIVANGALLEGANGVAAELGHVCFRKNGRHCHCGKRGCLETYVSATALRRTFLQLCGEESSYRSSINKKLHKLKAKSIIQAAVAGDPLAQQSLEQTANWLGEALANVINLTGSAAIFVAGGLAKSAELFFPTTKQALETELLPALRNKVELQVSGLLATNPAILGAAYHFFKTQKKLS